MNARLQVQQLLNFIDASPTPWHVVDSIKNKLLEHPDHWQPLDEAANWKLEAGGHYYVVRDDSSIILFICGQKPPAESGFKIIGAHTDSPGLRIKPNPFMSNNGLLRLAVEIYGAPILATFADRELSFAGKISYKDVVENKIGSRLINFDRPVLRLPNLAIHLNRGVNEEGLKFQKQIELGMFISTLTAEQIPNDYFLCQLQQLSGIEVDQILSWDLAVYDTQKGNFWGINDEFYANSQLDNLASCHAALQALLTLDGFKPQETLICAFFDHEEIGSESSKGAAGSFLPNVLHRIALTNNGTSDEIYRAAAKSLMISADMAHGYHPNFAHAYDHNHKAMINQGPVIKINANHNYASEGLSSAMFIDCCKQAGIPYQYYSHRCDLPCGSTVGPIVSAKLGIRCVDVGNAMWAMHSLRESAGVLDHGYMIEAMSGFFKYPH